MNKSASIILMTALCCFVLVSRTDPKDSSSTTEETTEITTEVTDEVTTESTTEETTVTE